MKKIHAELTVLYTKVHTLHYNVVGADFYNIHKFTEECYEFIHTMIDKTGESIIMEGKKPYGTLAECLATAHIKEISSREFKGKEVLKILQEDFEYLLEYVSAEDITMEMELNQVSLDVLDELKATLTKYIWMINATLK